MRTISSEMQARLDSGATSFCRCWLVKRRDGEEFGFTDHDRGLTFEGTWFNAGSGLDASVLEASTGLSVDNAQAIGALSDDSLSEADILAGKFDGAEVYHWIVDWQNVALRSLLFRGFLGEIRRGTAAFEAELRGIGETLNQPVGRSYLPECDRVFGDAKCGLDITNPLLSVEVPVLKITSNRRLHFAGLDGFASRWFANGSVRWGDGRVSLIKADSYDGTERILELWEEVRVPVNIGEVARVVAGCNKLAKACRNKFDNFDNFRGFPHIPGEDFVTTFPSRTENHDGSSFFTEVGNA